MLAAAMKHATIRGVLEFSKRMVTGILAMFAAQVILSMVILWLQRESAESIVELMRVCIPFYVTGLAGYSAKAGVENALKIMNDAKQATGAEANCQGTESESGSS